MTGRTRGLTRRGLTIMAATIAFLAAAGGIAWATTGARGHRHRGLGTHAIARIAQRTAGRSRVIVLLRDEFPSLPADRADIAARVRAESADRAPLERAVRASGGTIHISYRTINAFAATVSAAERARLARDPQVSQVLPDVLVHEPAPTATLGYHATPRSRAQATPAGSDVTTQLPDGQQICPTNPDKPLIEPEGLSLIKDPQARALGFDGSGVKVAFFAEGIDVDNPDFIRPDGAHVIVDYKDFTGEGPNAQTTGGEAFGDAGTIAAQGRVTYDLSDFVAPAHTLPAGCNIKLEGVAPGASLYAMKVFGYNADAFNSVIAQAIDYAVGVDHVNVLNESFGTQPLPDTDADLIKQLNDAAVAAGVTVTVASGDQGTANTIGSPASDPKVMDVGATTQFQGVAQTIRGGYQLSNAGWTDDNIAEFSSGGILQNGSTLDLVAPGNESFEPCTVQPGVSAADQLYQDCENRQGIPSNLSTFGGTSESSPMTAGVAALVIQAYRATHGGQSPTPTQVKQVITSNADDLDIPSDEQGAGELDALAAVQAAESLPGGTPTGSGRLVSPSQLDLSATAGSPVSGSVQLTNDGASTQTYDSSVRALSSTKLSDDAGALQLTPNTDPTFVDDEGNTQGYQTIHFTVPAGAQRIDAALAHPNGDETVNMVLVDPTGKYTAYTYHPQDDNASYSHVDVRNPPAGTWTAEFFSVAHTCTSTSDPGPCGYTGPVQYDISTSKFVGVGSVSPASVTLAPGQSTTLQVSDTAPATPGDYSRDLAISDSSGATSVVPIVTRSLVDLSHGSGTFSGAITGGDGDYALARDDTFAFDVSPGAPELGVDLTLPSDPQTTITGYLVSPSGQAVAQQSDFRASGAENLQLHWSHPVPGQWRFVLATANPVGGTALTGPFHGSVSEAAYPVSSSGIPDWSTIRRGHRVTAAVTVRNTGPVALSLFADPRPWGRTTAALVGVTPTTVTLPIGGTDPVPTFIVPTETSGLQAAARGSAPLTFDWGPEYTETGDPDLGSTSQGDVAYGQTSDPELTPGAWYMYPDLLGPFSAPVSGTAQTGMVALTRPFDPRVTSSTGDPQLADIDADAPAANPVTVAPGATATITVRFAASGHPGDVDSGELYLDDAATTSDASSELTSAPGAASELAALPYAFRIGPAHRHHRW